MSKLRKLNVRLIGRDETAVKGNPYAILDALIAANHPHLATAKIALAWHLGWKADADERIKLGQAQKASDLDRQLHGYDFVILLNRPVWNMEEWGPRDAGPSRSRALPLPGHARSRRGGPPR